MKTIFFGLFLNFLVFSSPFAFGEIFRERVNVEETDKLLKENLPKKRNWAIPEKIFRQGITKIKDAKTGVIIGWEVQLSTWPEKTNSRLWRERFLTLYISDSNLAFLSECGVVYEKKCNVRERQGVRVKNPFEESFYPEEMSFLGTQSFWVDNPVLDAHLVWLYDLFETLKITPLGQKVFVDGVEIINWVKENDEISKNWLLHDKEEEYPFDIEIKVKKNCPRKIQSVQISGGKDTEAEYLVFWGCPGDAFLQAIYVRFISMTEAEVIFDFSLPVVPHK